MSETTAHLTDLVIPFTSVDGNEIVLEEPDGELVAEPENDIEGNGAELRLTVEDVLGLLKIAEAYARMDRLIADTPMLVAARRDDADPDEHYKFRAGPFFANIGNVKLNGQTLTFDDGKDEVFLYERGDVFTIRTSDEGYSLAVSFTRQDLEDHLKSVASGQ
jgi:hypothetical protein